MSNYRFEALQIQADSAMRNLTYSGNIYSRLTNSSKDVLEKRVSLPALRFAAFLRKGV